MALIDEMKADTSWFLDQWGESLSIDRPVNSWTAGRATQSWSDQGVVTGDWQPLSGAENRAEEGRAVKSDAKVITLIDADVQEGDRCYKTDGTFMYVNYIKKFECHWTVFLTKSEPQ